MSCQKTHGGFMTATYMQFIGNDTFFACGNIVSYNGDTTGWVSLWDIKKSVRPRWTKHFSHSPYAPYIRDNSVLINLGGNIHFLSLADGKTLRTVGENLNRYTMFDSKNIIGSIMHSKDMKYINIETGVSKIIKGRESIGHIDSIIKINATGKVIVVNLADYGVEKSSPAIYILDINNNSEGKDLLNDFSGFPFCVLSDEGNQMAFASITGLYWIDIEKEKVISYKLPFGDTANYIEFKNDHICNVNFERNERTNTSFEWDFRNNKLTKVNRNFPFNATYSKDKSLVAINDEDIKGNVILKIYKYSNKKLIKTLNTKIL
jgi:hypothetical protein